ncbi:MAG: hypothetical protein DRN95_04895, partial [Candidatus Hydrothermarchaeota archaeon]
KITITLYIAFVGATDAQINSWAQEISDVWNGDGQTYGDCKCEVVFKVNTTKVASCTPMPAGWHCVTVLPWDGTDASLPHLPAGPRAGEAVVAYMGKITQSPSVGGASLDGEWSDQASRPVNPNNPQGEHYKDAAHEAGHMMGLDDGEGGIMNFTSGPNAKPTQAHINKIVENLCGANACPDRCCCKNGKIDRDKGEACDPFATPNGCASNEYCCPVCCNCYVPLCNPSKGKYPSEKECTQFCTGELKKCYYNYKTGCWDCVKLKVIIENLATESTRQKTIEQLKINKWWFTKESLKELYGEIPGWEELEKLEPDLTDWPLGNITCDHSKSDNAKKFMELYNSNLITLPIVSKLFANERINIYIEGGDDYSIVTSNKQIERVYGGPLEDQTVNIYTNQEIIEEINSGRLSITEALDEGKIRYEGVGFYNSLKFRIANFIFDIYSRF